MPQPGTMSSWSEEEDQRLRELVTVYGDTKWTKIAMDLGSKGSKQCRRRWLNHLNVAESLRNVGSWSKEEDERLLEGHRIHGNKWTEIAKTLRGRTDNAVKNRYHALQKSRPGASKRGRRNQEVSDESSVDSDMDADLSRDPAAEEQWDEAPGSKRRRAIDRPAHAQLSRGQVLFCFREDAVSPRDKEQLQSLANTGAPVRFFQTKDSPVPASEQSFQCFVPANEPQRAAEDVLLWLKGCGPAAGMYESIGSTWAPEPTVQQRAAMKRLFLTYRREPLARSASPSPSPVSEDEGEPGDVSVVSVPTSRPGSPCERAEVSSKLCLEAFLGLLIDACSDPDAHFIPFDAALPE